jgi:hypothetical protein
MCAAEGRINGMLIPRFSVRWLLVVTAVSAVVALIVSQAMAGHVWAIALSATLGAAAAMFAIQSAVFLLAWSMAAAWRARRRPEPSSPFAAHTVPPQLLPPPEVD